jgi:hypothetical protein
VRFTEPALRLPKRAGFSAGALKGAASRLRLLDDRILNMAARFTGLYRMATGLDLTHTVLS